jgi:hypothetical protein
MLCIRLWSATSRGRKAWWSFRKGALAFGVVLSFIENSTTFVFSRSMAMSHERFNLPIIVGNS